MLAYIGYVYTYICCHPQYSTRSDAYECHMYSVQQYLPAAVKFGCADL